VEQIIATAIAALAVGIFGTRWLWPRKVRVFIYVPEEGDDDWEEDDESCEEDDVKDDKDYKRHERKRGGSRRRGRRDHG
jgi:hypothetical protein